MTLKSVCLDFETQRRTAGITEPLLARAPSPSFAARRCLWRLLGGLLAGGFLTGRRLISPWGLAVS